MNTLVYIAGFGMSGSTLLDMLLGSEPGIVGLGEVMYLPDYVMHGKTCTCGRLLRACDLWGRVLPAEGAPEARFFGGRFHHETIYREVGRQGYRLDPDTAAWARYQFELLRGVARATRRTVFVDSSKNLPRLRLYEMVRPPDFRICVVHLVRDLLGVLDSTKTKRWIPSPIRAAAAWFHTNYAVAQYLRRGRHEWVSATYRDLALRTLEMLNRVYRRFGLPEIAALPVCTVEGKHNIEGNPSRFHFTRIYYDEDWKHTLGVWEKALGWGLHPAYRYFASVGAS